MHLTILNGPSLNLTGYREPSIYGNQTMDDMMHILREAFPTVEWHYQQSNHEGVLIDALHLCRSGTDGVILNAGALSHTSIALADAVRALSIPVVEVHITNLWARESYRHHSYMSTVVQGVIAGFGLESYLLAAQYLVTQALQTNEK